MNRLASPAALALIALLAVPVSAAEERLPTPYTAEEIRGAFAVGYEYVLEVTTPQGLSWTRTRVLESAGKTVRLEAQPLDEHGKPAGEPAEQTAKWTELRDHASFPAEVASRERATRETALGELEGWLYRAEAPDGSVSEFFFADALPGPPVEYVRTMDGEPILEARMTERTVPE